MLEKPDLPDDALRMSLHSAYGLNAERITFLPLGADPDTAVYRVATDRAHTYFVKLRRGTFLSASVAVPRYLYNAGMRTVIPPVPTSGDALWTTIGSFAVILYPFVAGRNGFEVPLSAPQRIAFGQAVKTFHTAAIPIELTQQVPRETFTPSWCETVRTFLRRNGQPRPPDELARTLSAFLQDSRQTIEALLHRTEQLACVLRREPPPLILCHGDLHGWNLLLEPQGPLYIVDWDTLTFGPKERDLMFVGCGLGGRVNSLEEEVDLFYAGYGHTAVNHVALAYYRYARIVEDIAVYCEQIFSTAGELDRQQGLTSLQSNFLPGGTIDLAFQLDRSDKKVICP